MGGGGGAGSLHASYCYKQFGFSSNKMFMELMGSKYQVSISVTLFGLGGTCVSKLCC